jgi:hypothetical protein
MGTVLHLRTIRLQSRGVKQFKRQSQSWETVGRASLGCGLLSVGGEVTNHVAILPQGDVIRDSAVQLGCRGSIG